MKHLFSTRKLIVLAAACMLSAGTLWAEINPKPFIVPELKEWKGAEGMTQLSGNIVVKSSKLNAVAQALAADYKEMFGKELTIKKGKAKAGDIVLTLANKELGAEGYKLEIGETVNVVSPTAQGAFWATRTLLQMSEQNAQRELPRGVTTDKPEYKLRGFMIDCGRKFFSVTSPRLWPTIR